MVVADLLWQKILSATGKGGLRALIGVLGPLDELESSAAHSEANIVHSGNNVTK